MRIGNVGTTRKGGLLLLSLAAIFCFPSQGVELLRGPYLQSASSQSVIVRWRTDSPTPSHVAYGTESGSLSFSATSAELTNEHIVALSGLLPETSYFYSIGTGTQILASGNDLTFATAPPPGVARPTRVWVIGDSGGVATGYGDPIAVRDAYYEYAADRRPDVFLLLGDNAYESGSDAEYQAGFFEVYPVTLAQTAAWPAIGNHDLDNYPIGGPWPYEAIFSLPTNAEAGGVPSGTESYYSFVHGNVHFICLDSTLQSRETNSPMAAWLRADLAANSSAWMIAFFHHAPYSMGSHNTDNFYELQMTQMRENILPILEEGGVDLVLGGHSHNYERSYLLYEHYRRSTNLTATMILDQGTGREEETGPYVKTKTGAMANKGTVYVVSGNASECESFKGEHPVMLTRSTERGSFVLDIDGDRLEGTSLTVAGTVCDRFSIVKGPPAALRICGLKLEGDNTILSWKSSRGKTYQVEMRHFGMPQWQNIGMPLAATGATTFWTNSTPTGASSNFYRVLELNPQPAASSP